MRVVTEILSYAIVSTIAPSTAMSTKGNRFPVLATRLSN